MLSILLFAAAAVVDPGVERFLPQGTTSIVAMEWRKVLNSPYREYFKREIPASAAALLNGINFIEGIERVVIASAGNTRLVILHGQFDMEELRAAALEDGGSQKLYKQVQFLVPPNATPADTQMALVNSSLILLGDGRSLTQAIDHPGAPARVPGGADLWVYTPGRAGEVRVSDLRMALSDGIELQALVRATEELASNVETNARNAGFQAERTGAAVQVKRKLAASELEEAKAGWRSYLETDLSKTPRPQVIKIIGLEGGTREIPLPPQ